jgi:hypothetical protein
MLFAIKSMEKTDLARKYKSYYSAKSKPELVEFGKISYLSISGKGDPSAEVFGKKVQALYAVAYALKFKSKANGQDFIVPKLEGLWWYDGDQNLSLSEVPLRISRSEWCWRLLIRMPESLTGNHLKEAIPVVKVKKNIPYIDEVEFFTLTEGKVVQMLHVGSFDKEPETLKVIQQFTTDHGLQKAGLHHEIYLSDFRKTAPARLKTILREPVK